MNRVENTVPWHPCHIPADRENLISLGYTYNTVVGLAYMLVLSLG